MRVYQTRSRVLKGTDLSEVRNKAFIIFNRIKKKSKRQPYIRSAYFDKSKIFLNLFWDHLFKKIMWQDRLRRLIFFEAALELIQFSRFDPQTKDNPNKAGEVLHRFCGKTKDDLLFYVQIKENKRNGQKHLISIFPEK